MRHKWIQKIVKASHIIYDFIEQQCLIEYIYGGSY
jgi:hypothetical protein